MFHRYTNYDAWDGRLYLYDFGSKQIACLSERWEIDHAINGNQPGSDSSAPYPIDDRLVVFSSTRPGGRGGYDLYLGDREDGASWPLSSPGINTAQEELGASYARAPVKK
jgi:hypothetical protein